MQLAEEEKQDLVLGPKPLHDDVSASLLIWQGLEIKEQQLVFYHYQHLTDI